jgi:hypothetical protein
MNRREVMTSAVLGAALAPSVGFAQPAKTARRGPPLLTVTGAIVRTNRGPLNPALDQLMQKHKVAFDKAYTFDFAAIAALPGVTIKPTLEYDEKPHTLTGPLLTELVKVAAPNLPQSANLLLRAIDGYALVVTLTDARRYRFIVAHTLDGQPIPLGGLGPLWAVYDADRFPDMAAKPVKERFASCPWGLYHIDVQQGGSVRTAG